MESDQQKVKNTFVAPFVCGVGQFNSSGVPTRITVCPEEGADVMYVYKLVERKE